MKRILRRGDRPSEREWVKDEVNDAEREVEALSTEARFVILAKLAREGVLQNPENGQLSDWRVTDAGSALGIEASAARLLERL